MWQRGNLSLWTKLQVWVSLQTPLKGQLVSLKMNLDQITKSFTFSLPQSNLQPFTKVTVQRGRGNTDSFQGLLDTGFELTLILEYPKNYCDLQNALFTITIFHTVLCPISEFTLQPEKCNSGPTVMESTYLTMFLNILKQLA